MPNAGLFSHADLPYQPLPEAASQAARISILKRDFPQEAILDEYSFSTRSAEQAYKVLRQVRYAGFVPDMLTSIYTAAYSKEERKNLGRFDTPLYLTRRIWENIPIEYLPPHQRVVADMTCGWGSFLIAGHERLSTLTDTRPSRLRAQLHGNDVDPFTAQLAGLGLLLSTSEDSWDIDSSNALEWDWLKQHQPNIIVGNPPFGADRKRTLIDKNSSTKRKRYEKANKFLEYAIDSILKVAYHLDDATFERLRKVMEWDNKPQITLDTKLDQTEANWLISGIVDSIDTEEGAITLWMEGFDELQPVQIVPSMPGWMLRSEATFRTKIPRQYVKQGHINYNTDDWGAFRPQPYAYMEEEELLDEFAKLMQEDSGNRVR